MVIKIVIEGVDLKDEKIKKAIIGYLIALIENAGEYIDQNPVVNGLTFYVEKP